MSFLNDLVHVLGISIGIELAGIVAMIVFVYLLAVAADLFWAPQNPKHNSPPSSSGDEAKRPLTGPERPL